MCHGLFLPFLRHLTARLAKDSGSHCRNCRVKRPPGEFLIYSIHANDVTKTDACAAAKEHGVKRNICVLISAHQINDLPATALNADAGDAIALALHRYLRLASRAARRRAGAGRSGRGRFDRTKFLHPFRLRDNRGLESGALTGGGGRGGNQRFKCFNSVECHCRGRSRQWSWIMP